MNGKTNACMGKAKKITLNLTNTLQGIYASIPYSTLDQTSATAKRIIGRAYNSYLLNHTINSLEDDTIEFKFETDNSGYIKSIGCYSGCVFSSDTSVSRRYIFNISDNDQNITNAINTLISRVHTLPDGQYKLPFTVHNSSSLPTNTTTILYDTIEDDTPLIYFTLENGNITYTHCNIPTIYLSGSSNTTLYIFPLIGNIVKIS